MINKNRNDEKFKFSIIVPVYNVEKYLRKCLDSIINQSFTNFEVICVNDGSTDNSGKILKEYVAKDKRFVIIEQENQGQGAARNKALDIAKGEYIVFVDPDDWIEPNALEEIYNAFQNAKTEVIEFDYYRHDWYSGKVSKNNRAIYIKKKFNYDLKHIPYYNRKIFRADYLYRFDHHAWRRAYSHKFLKEAGAVFAPAKYGEDHLFVIAVLLNASRIFYLEKYLYNYRTNIASAAAYSEERGFYVFQNCQLLHDYLITHNLYSELKEEFSLYQIQMLAQNYRDCIREEHLAKYKSMCKEFLTKNEYKKMLDFANKDNSPLKFIFSFKNTIHQGIKCKTMTILGRKFIIKPKSAEKRNFI